MKPNYTHLISAEEAPQPGSAAQASSEPKSPQGKKHVKPGWRPTIIRCDSFQRLREIQKSTSDPTLDLSYLSDACIQIALELGPEQIVRRAIADLKPRLRQP